MKHFHTVTPDPTEFGKEHLKRINGPFKMKNNLPGYPPWTFSNSIYLNIKELSNYILFKHRAFRNTIFKKKKSILLI